MRERRIYSGLLGLEELDAVSAEEKPELAAERRLNFDRLSTLIQRLKPLDRQVILCWLESMDTESIAEVTGLSPASVAMRVHRIKGILTRQFGQGV